MSRNGTDRNAKLSPAKLAEKQRLADALRANLKRRKAVANRGDAAADATPETIPAPADENEG